MGTILDEESSRFSLLCCFAVAFELYAKSSAFILSHILRADLCKFITNLFDPWKILTQLLIRSQFWCSFGSLHEIVRDLQCLSSWNIVQLRNPAPIQNLPQFSCCDSLSIRYPYCCNRKSYLLGHHNPKERLFWQHWARVRNLIVPSQRVSREGIHTLHISLRLLRKDWARLQTYLCEK